MTPTRWLIVAFWIFIPCMLIWQAYTSEVNSERELAAHPKQEHFFFDAPDTKPTVDPNAFAAKVLQVGFSITNNPMQSNFIAHVTLKNMGNAKATGIQVWVRPYRGVSVGGSRNGDGAGARQLPDDDPISLMGQWVSFPDLAPDESYTYDVTFISRDDVKPGANPKPQIVFESEKPQPPSDDTDTSTNTSPSP
jgi:hypothetical protein